MNTSTPFTVHVGDQIPQQCKKGLSISLADGLRIEGVQSGSTFILDINGTRVFVSRPLQDPLTWPYHNFINVHMKNVAKFGDDIGGILGLDSHSDQEKFYQECRDKLQMVGSRILVGQAVTFGSKLGRLAADW